MESTFISSCFIHWGSRNKPYVNVCLSIDQGHLDSYLCSLFTGKWVQCLRWNCFLCSIHAWEEYSRLGTVSCLLESTAAVQTHTFVRWWTCFVRFSQVNVTTDYDETFLSVLYKREIIIVSLKLSYVLWKENGGNVLRTFFQNNGGRSNKCFGRNTLPVALCRYNNNAITLVNFSPARIYPLHNRRSWWCFLY